MPDLMKITHASAIFPAQLSLTWDDGVTMTVDVGASLTRHPILKMLTSREVFEDLSIIHDGRGIGWANGADFCADALRILADEQAKTIRKSA